MRKIHLICLLLPLLASCGEEAANTFTVKGEIKGLGTDTLYIYGTDLLHNRTDTLPVTKDKFSATFEIDTLATAWLQFSDASRYPIFLDKGIKLTIKGTADDPASLEITGSVPNNELTAFHKEMKETGGDSGTTPQEKAEEYIRSHPASMVSVYLLEKYFVQTPEPDYNRIRSLTNGMSGVLKDRPYVENLLSTVKEVEKRSLGRITPFIQSLNAKGERISRNSFKDKYLLVHFWASWSPESLQANADLRRIYEQEKKNKKFALWGISLDLDRKEWEAAVERDTLVWEQCCDFKGWNCQSVKQLSIQTLPANILLAPNGRIEGMNLDRAAIEKKLKEIKERDN